ncbi:MAG: DUF2252 family protein, partial [Myxococcota bacterium]|nr:DUF2252 family protein [Myxococcota bacterium]
DLLFLQAKEATRSVLAEHLDPSPYTNEGQRVVEGQRLMQALNDIFLGWAHADEAGRDYYLRQLRDWKGSVNVDDLDENALSHYAALCGQVLARGHARSGDAVAIAGYLGSGDVFDRALASFAERYADQNARDFGAFAEEIRSERLEAAHPAS